ncbi:MAG: GNAT family N-acetyltransferase [Chloroflexota bacterium]
MATSSEANLRPERPPVDGILARGRMVALRELVWADLEDIGRWPPFVEADLQWANSDLKSAAQRQIWFRHEMYDPTRKRLAIVFEDRLVGVLGLRSIDFRRRRATIGIRLSAAEVDQGFGTDAIQALFTYAFGRLGLERLDLDVAVGNRRAQRCYEKCGFRLVGQHRDLRGNIFLDMTVSAAEARHHGEGPLSS